MNAKLECERCGAQYTNEQLHDRFHDQIETFLTHAETPVESLPGPRPRDREGF